MSEPKDQVYDIIFDHLAELERMREALKNSAKSIEEAQQKNNALLEQIIGFIKLADDSIVSLEKSLPGDYFDDETQDPEPVKIEEPQAPIVQEPEEAQDEPDSEDERQPIWPKILDEVFKMMVELQSPISKTDVVLLLEERGIKVGGTDKGHNLRVQMSKDPRFISWKRTAWTFNSSYIGGKTPKRQTHKAR